MGETSNTSSRVIGGVADPHLAVCASDTDDQNVGRTAVSIDGWGFQVRKGETIRPAALPTVGGPDVAAHTRSRALGVMANGD